MGNDNHGIFNMLVVTECNNKTRRENSKKKTSNLLVVVIIAVSFFMVLRHWYSSLVFSFNQGSDIFLQLSYTLMTVVENNSPVCQYDLFDKRNFNFEKMSTKSYDSADFDSKIRQNSSCHLLQYTSKSAVRCFDAAYEKQVFQDHFNNKTKRSTYLHFIFMGDSRIRQQFFNFLKLIPDYDRITIPAQIVKFWVPFHGDVEVYSKVLRLKVSFKWCHIINQTSINSIRQWTIADKSNRPNFIFLSIEIYHMLQDYGADLKLYKHRLVELGAALNHLANASQVIWLNQYPTIEAYGNVNDRNTDIHTEKIHHYNEVVRRIFKSYSGVRLWDSSNLLAEEYIRGCKIIEREIPNQIFLKSGPDQFINCKPYINCLDFVHTGYVALAEATQLFYNNICNSELK